MVHVIKKINSSEIETKYMSGACQQITWSNSLNRQKSAIKDLSGDNQSPALAEENAEFSKSEKITIVIAIGLASSSRTAVVASETNLFWKVGKCN